jgi:hypothetical protein
MSKPKPTPTLPAFTKARKAGVPIVAIETADPGAAIVKCMRSLNGKEEITPFLCQDVIRGVTSLNKPGAEVLGRIEGAADLTEPSQCLKTLVEYAGQLTYSPDPENDETRIGAVLFAIHANRWLDDTGCCQAVWNSRDVFEHCAITLVLLGPSIKLPVELKNDVVVISEPLPGQSELDGILTDIAEEADLKDEQLTEREVITDTMSGTSAFGARQILAMSVTREGIDKDQLWERKRKMIEQCPGLSVWTVKPERLFDSDLNIWDNASPGDWLY